LNAEGQNFRNYTSDIYGIEFRNSLTMYPAADTWEVPEAPD